MRMSRTTCNFGGGTWSREIGEIREEDERRTRREREIPQALVSISQQSVRSRMYTEREHYHTITKHPETDSPTPPVQHSFEAGFHTQPVVARPCTSRTQKGNATVPTKLHVEHSVGQALLEAPMQHCPAHCADDEPHRHPDADTRSRTLVVALRACLFPHILT